MEFFQHPTAIVETASVGPGTRIGPFAHILAGARIGRGCAISSHTFIGNDVVLGDRVTIQPGVYIAETTRLEDDVFIGPNATLSSPGFPASIDGSPGNLTIVRKGASIGATATLLSGITIEEGVTVAPGAVVTLNVPRNAIVSGNPARIVGYGGVQGPETAPGPPAACPDPAETRVAGVVVRNLPLVSDLRGMLSFAEVGRHIPFAIKRYFLVFGVATEHIRGEHAHRTLHQFLVCIQGRCHVLADDGTGRQEFLLDSPHIGIYIPPMTWAVQYRFSPDAVLLVLASDYYDAGDYIREYPEFLALKLRR